MDTSIWLHAPQTRSLEYSPLIYEWEKRVRSILNIYRQKGPDRNQSRIS